MSKGKALSTPEQEEMFFDEFVITDGKPSEHLHLNVVRKYKAPKTGEHVVATGHEIQMTSDEVAELMETSREVVEACRKKWEKTLQDQNNNDKKLWFKKLSPGGGGGRTSSTSKILAEKGRETLSALT